MDGELTRDYRESIREDLKSNPELRKEMLVGTLNCFLEGDMELGRALFRNYIKSEYGYKNLAAEIGISEKSLNRMFGPKGNPTSRNLLKIVSALTEHEGIKLKVVAEKA